MTEQTADLTLEERRRWLYQEAREAAADIVGADVDDYSTVSFNLGKLYVLAGEIYDVNHQIEGR